MGKKVQSYTAEFRAEAVKLVLAQGLTLQEVSISPPASSSASWWNCSSSRILQLLSFCSFIILF